MSDSRMTDAEIDALWQQHYEAGYLDLPLGERNLRAGHWVKNATIRPHQAFARAVEAEAIRRERERCIAVCDAEDVNIDEDDADIRCGQIGMQRRIKAAILRGEDA